MAVPVRGVPSSAPLSLEEPTSRNHFAETEQVAVNASSLGGPNWNHIPINRAHAPISDISHDGWHEDAVHGRVAAYRPNSLDRGCPFRAGTADGAFFDVPARVAAGAKVREHHVVASYTFELPRCYDETIRRRQLQALANIGAQFDADTVIDEQEAVHQSGDVALVVASHGGPVKGVVVPRTYANSASVEFDALIVLGETLPTPDQSLGEAWRHAKIIGVVNAVPAAQAAGVENGAVGVVTGAADDVLSGVIELLVRHRAWERFAPVSA